MKLDPELATRLHLRPVDRGRYEIVIPERANIAADTVGRHAHGPKADRIALEFEETDGTMRRWTYAELDTAATRLAVGLRRLGVERGEPVGIHTGSRPETAMAHLAVCKLGAVACTISQLYGPETVQHIIEDAGLRVLVTQESVWRDRVPSLRHVLVAGTRELENAFAEDIAGFTPIDTHREDAALLIYTSGSTGRPKGILHAHRIVHAYKTSLDLFYDIGLDEPDLAFWTPADWAWVGGWNDVVLPGWWYGHRVVASQARFDAEWCFDFMARHRVTHSLMTATALKRLAQVPSPRTRWPVTLRCVFTGGEPLPGETHRWLSEELGIVCNEGYGLSEVNHMIGNCALLKPIRPGSMGWEFPGHVAALVDEDGNEVPPGEVGEIVTSPDDPTLFLGYWNQPALTAAMRLGKWVRTHDLAVKDDDGYFWYRGRSDDLIKSGGFRIGPAEIEDVLLTHPAVAEAGVIGSPDEARGHIVKAYVRVAAGHAADDALVAALQEHVRVRLGGYKVPRRIEFLDDFPTTSTAKLSRKGLRQLDREGR